MSSIEEQRGALPAPVESGTRPLRASDAERESAVAVLHQALGDGRLDLTETDKRVSAAYAARYCDELLPLVADLPQPRPEPGAPSWAELWASLVWRARILISGELTHPAPTQHQQRIAALIVGLAVVWMLVCVVAGAALVGS